MSHFEQRLLQEQQSRNQKLMNNSRFLGDQIESKIIPFHIDTGKDSQLSEYQIDTLRALEISAARTAIKSLASLAEINELDHLGGGLDLIPALTMTLAVSDHDLVQYTIEHAHTSIGYFSVLSTYGFLDENYVIQNFRRSLDIAGHVAWVAGGTQLNGGRLGIMVPVAVGQALGKRAIQGEDVWVIAHCGDAGWISGQALNGFNAADIHNAPVTFIMHRNGIQLSGSNKQIMNKDPRPVIESLGITLLEIPSLLDPEALYSAYCEARVLARQGRPTLIYPVGYQSTGQKVVDLNTFADMYGISKETVDFAEKHQVALTNKIWIPGSLMSYRDIDPMLECLFLVNEFEGGKGHHDGHMKGRSAEQVLNNPMLTLDANQIKILDSLTRGNARIITTNARPQSGSTNLKLAVSELNNVVLPEPGKNVSPRAGVEKGYELVAAMFPHNVFIVGCDLDTSTKLGKARAHLKQDHQFEMSIEEQASALMANGLAMSSDQHQLNVFSTFAAFFEGIAREGFELWRYQRNLNGSNEGLNVTFHLSHVGACTGRDHFSGWGLDWINLAIGYLPHLHRFYAPADARSAFIAVCDLAAHYGGHIIGIPRDNLPVLSRQDSEKPLFNPSDSWEAVSKFRSYEGAKHAILAMGAPAFLAETAAEQLQQEKIPTDVYIVNGLPVEPSALQIIFQTYTGGIVTIEDGIIGSRNTGLRGFASFLACAVPKDSIHLEHIGIVDPRIAPSDGHFEVWNHFGITADALIRAVRSMA